MAKNPYLQAYWVQRRNRRRADGGSMVVRGLLALIAVAVLALLLRPVFLGFLDEGQGAHGAGVAGIVLRLGLVLIGLSTIDLYGAMIRGRDREVLAGLPVDPAQVARYVLTRVAWERAWVVLAAAGLLLPVAVESSVELWLVASVAMAGLWLFSLPASAVAHLLAVLVAEAPLAAPLLDLVRGANTRAQAAFIYAPGMVVVAATAALWAASAGIEMIWGGHAAGALLLAVPVALGAGLAWWVPRLAQITWFRATAVLSDIDAQVAAVQQEHDEQLHVYLDWSLRFMPAALRPFALKDLRHGWRARRTWLSGAWILGIAAAAAGWTYHSAGPSRAVSVVVLAVALCAGVAIALEQDEPPFLRWWLPQPGRLRWTARGLVLVLWLQPVVWPAVLITAFFHGLDDSVRVLIAGEVAVASSAALAMACSLLRARGAWLYAAAAVGLAAVIVVAFVGLDGVVATLPLDLFKGRSS